MRELICCANCDCAWVAKLHYASVRDNDNLKSHKYVCITTYQPDAKSNPNPNPNPNPTILNNMQ